MVHRKIKRETTQAGPFFRATAKDVAQATGVSTTTVASILSGRNVVRVAEATRERVLAAAHEMGYRRNRLATALRTGRTNTIGIVSPLTWSGVQGNVHLLYLTNLLTAISVAASRMGMNAMTFIDSPLEELPASEVADGRVGGVILFGMPMNQEGAEAWIRELDDMGLPIVEIGSCYSRYQVHADNAAGASQAVEHLLALGHRRIAYWRRSTGRISAERREAGFLASVRAAGLSAAHAPIMDTGEELRALLQHPERPTALFCNDDNRALHAYDHIHAAGLRVPEDISVVGFDNGVLAGAMRPRLTSVDNPLNVMAQSAVALLLAQQEEKEIASPTLLAETRLVLRDSTASPSPAGE